MYLNNVIVLLQAYVVDGMGNVRSASSIATVAISVEDVNDNDPVLENPHPNPITLLEVGHTVLCLYAPCVCACVCVCVCVCVCIHMRVLCTCLDLEFLVLSFVLQMTQYNVNYYSVHGF